MVSPIFAMYYQFLRTLGAFQAVSIPFLASVCPAAPLPGTDAGPGESSTPQWQLTVNAGGGGHVTARQVLPAQGTELWRAEGLSQSFGDATWSIPAIADDGTIYVLNLRTYADVFGYLMSLSPEGALRWSREVEVTRFDYPVIGPDGSIYVPHKGELRSYSSDGTLLSSRVLGDPTHPTSRVRPPAIDSNGNLLVTLSTRTLFRLSPDGQIQWSYPDAFPQSPTLAEDGRMYFREGWLEFDAQGNVTDQFRYGFGSSLAFYFGPAHGHNGQFHVPNHDLEVYEQSTLKWSLSASTAGPFRAAPVIAPDGTVYACSSEGKLVALTPGGDLKWVFSSNHTAMDSTPVVAADGTVYFASSHPTHPEVYALNPDGSLRWKHSQVQNPDGYRTSLARVSLARDGTVLFGAPNGWLYALQGDALPATSQWPRPGGNLRNTNQIAHAPPAVTRQPVDVDVIAGDSTTFSLEYTGLPTPAVTWYRVGAEPPVGTAPTLVLDPVAADLAGAYFARLTNEVGSVDSEPASLVVRYRLAVQTDSGGVVTVAPEGQAFLPGTPVTLTAEPKPFHVFSGWSGALSGTVDQQMISMQGNTTVHAHFLPTYTLQVDIEGNGTVVVNPQMDRYPEGTLVQLQAIPSPTNDFYRWHGSASPWSDTITVAVSDNTQLTATFGTTGTLDVQVVGPGTVIRTPDQPRYLADTEVLLNAIHTGPDIEFLGWSGAASGLGNPLPVVLTESLSVTANFVQLYHLQVIARSGGAVNQVPAGSRFRDGTSITLEAVPAAGFTFVRWDGIPLSTANPLVIDMDANRSLEAVFADVSDPVIVIHSPTGGVTPNEHVALEGTVTDNAGIAAASWSWNDASQGGLALDDSGRFAVAGLSLQRGDNVFVVTAQDLEGNHAAAAVTVTWAPPVKLYAGDFNSVREGLKVAVPLRLDSDGTVTGMTFTLAYDPTFLESPEVTWSSLLEIMFRQANLAEPGKILFTFAHPFFSLPAGTLDLGTVTFRARSVPESLASTLPIVVIDASDIIGDPLPHGVVADDGVVNIDIRSTLGDNNGNDRLDIGDSTIIQRLIAGSKERRPWDVTGNDLNQNTFLDSGDVIRVLRVVAGIDPQPGAPVPSLVVVPDSEQEEAAEMPEESPAGVADLLIFRNTEYVVTNLNGSITIEVLLDDSSTPVSGLSLVVEYDPTALRLADHQAHPVGPLVPGGSMALWNLEPAYTDYSRQSGRLHFATSRDIPWPQRTGVVAVLTFDLQPGAMLSKDWPIRITAAEITGDGFDVRTLAPMDAVVRIERPESLAFDAWADHAGIDPDRRAATDHGFGNGLPNLLNYALAKVGGAPERDRLPQVRLRTQDGLQHLAMEFLVPTHVRDVRYALEASADLVNWELVPSTAQALEAIPGVGTRMAVWDRMPIHSRSVRYLRLRVDL